MKKYREYEAKPESYAINGVTVRRPRYLQLPRGDWLGWSHRWFARFVAGKACKGFDLIHAHYAYPPGLAAVTAARVLGVPTVLTLHGDDVNQFPYIWGRSRRLFCTAVKGANALFAVSQALAERTIALTGRTPEVVPIGVDMRKFLPSIDKSLARRRLGIPAQKFVAVFVGYLYPEKGVRELLAALRILESRGVVCIFVGDGGLRNDVRQTPGAIAVGSVANERVLEFLAAADLFVLPSYTEGMPTVLVEAGAAGMPVLATAVGGIPELLADERGWLMPGPTVEAIVQGIDAAMTDGEGAARRARRLNDYVRQHYDADKNAARLAQTYERLLCKTCVES
jgi:teichuronic acid biosynthesis glycosyltransferase TuaC